MSKNTPTYLGDGLYADFDGYQIKLMANSYEFPTDTVYLDPNVTEALLKYIDKVNKELEEKAD